MVSGTTKLRREKEERADLCVVGESQLTEDSPEAVVPPPSPSTVLGIKPKASGV